MATYRIIKHEGGIKVQERSAFTLWRWKICSRFGGSFGNEDFVFASIEEAERAIAFWAGDNVIEVLKKVSA